MKILFNFVIGIGLLNSSLKKKKMVSESWMSFMIFDWSLEIKSKSPCLKRLDGMDKWNLMFRDKIRISKKMQVFFSKMEGGDTKLGINHWCHFLVRDPKIPSIQFLSIFQYLGFGIPNPKVTNDYFLREILLNFYSIINPR